MSNPIYIVKGTKDGKEVFYDTDSHSGGYPYASTFNFRRTHDVNEAIKWLKNCGPKGYASMDNATVCQIQFHPVDIAELVNRHKELSNYVETLSIADRKLLKDML